MRITTQDLNFPQDGDCYIAPDDPIHQYRIGGLKTQATPLSAEDKAELNAYFNPTNRQYGNSIPKKGDSSNG